MTAKKESNEALPNGITVEQLKSARTPQDVANIIGMSGRKFRGALRDGKLGKPVHVNTDGYEAFTLQHKINGVKRFTKQDSDK